MPTAVLQNGVDSYKFIIVSEILNAFIIGAVVKPTADEINKSVGNEEHQTSSVVT
jgi:hypothetical protein